MVHAVDHGHAVGDEGREHQTGRGTQIGGHHLGPGQRPGADDDAAFLRFEDAAKRYAKENDGDALYLRAELLSLASGEVEERARRRYCETLRAVASGERFEGEVFCQ